MEQKTNTHRIQGFAICYLVAAAVCFAAIGPQTNFGRAVMLSLVWPHTIVSNLVYPKLDEPTTQPVNTFVFKDGVVQPGNTVNLNGGVQPGTIIMSMEDFAPMNEAYNLVHDIPTPTDHPEPETPKDGNDGCDPWSVSRFC